MKRANFRGVVCAPVLVCLVLAAGCVTFWEKDRPAAGRAIRPSLERAESYYDQGRFADAMLECIDLARKDPQMPGLPELQQLIVRGLADERQRSADLKSADSYRLSQLDVDEHKNVPETYKLRRGVRGATGSLKTPSSAIQQALRKRVTVHLDGVNLNDFILAIGASEGINIVADATQSDRTMTLHADSVPLQEILDYVSRNLGVSFYAGENMMWATPTVEPAEAGAPMETRMYRLRRGLSSEEVEASDAKPNMEEAIARFVPAPSGAELFFDKKAHILIAKNTRENLSRVEELIEALDVSPPQVLIEARFISTGVNDLRELGIDWLMNSPITVSRKGDAVRSQIDPASIKFSPFAGASQGLNFTYQGLLTDPMFSAVIHALETTGKSQTLSVPRVTTVNNRPAKIRIGEDFRYFEEYEIQQAGTTTTTDDRGVTTTTQNSRLVPVGTPQLEELGIQLEVTPSVGADLSTITLHMVPEISEFVRFEVYETSTGSSSSTTNGTAVVKLPVFRRSTIETEVIVGSGETVVMGGLITSTESRKRNKVPLLGSLPLLGALFQNDEVTQQRQNLLIFVTATLLSSRGEDLVPLSPEPQTSAQGAAGT